MDRQETKRRLTLLANFLEGLDPDRFFYGEWVSEDWKGKPDLSCGTNACALGWAMAMPEFRELGFHMEKKEEDIPAFVTPAHPEGTYLALDAAQYLFGLTHMDAMFLFIPNTLRYDGQRSPHALATVTQVASHIRAFAEAIR